MTFHKAILSSKFLSKACFCVFLVFVLLFELAPLRGIAQSTTIAVAPTTYVVSQRQTFLVNITIADVVNCTGWQFGLYYRNDVLSATGVSEGSFLNSGGSTFFTVSLNNTYNSTTGFVFAACALLGVGVWVDGNGLLAQVTFQAIGEGNTTLHFTQTKLADEKIPPTANSAHRFRRNCPSDGSSTRRV